MIDAAELIDALSHAAAYAEPSREIVRHETHISWVFLTDRHAYKLKKPVRFDFLDYSTLQARRAACEAEVRLNRRLAPDVYLGVVPIVRDVAGPLHVEGQGEPVEWAVQMRRLADERRLDHLIQRGQLRDAEVEQVATRLADFYRQAAPLALDAARYRAAIEAHVRGNGRELLARDRGLPSGLVQRVQESQLRFLRFAPEVLDARVAGGRIVDGHGDLRPEHVYLLEPPVAIDCIEFNDEFRQIDAVDELCFFAMECDLLGAGDVGQRVLDVYCQTCDDAPPSALVAFYKSYRAAVRAKVHALRADQLADEQRRAALELAGQYLHLAERYRPAAQRPLVLIVGGLMGTGKSTLAAGLAEALGIEVLSTDAVRRELLGASEMPAAFGEGAYSADARRKVYEELFRRAGQFLEEDRSVILDGTFLSSPTRAEAAALAHRHGAVPSLIRCVCPDDIARARIAARAADGETLSEARPELLTAQRAEADDEPAVAPSIEIDTSAPLAEQSEKVIAAMRRVMQSPEVDD